MALLARRGSALGIAEVSEGSWDWDVTVVLLQPSANPDSSSVCLYLKAFAWITHEAQRDFVREFLVLETKPTGFIPGAC